MNAVAPRVSTAMPQLQEHVHVFTVAPSRDAAGPAAANADTASAPPGRIRPFNNRKAHTKSRAGCQACKRRRIKCDEAKPDCGYCTGRGVPCVYPDPPPPRTARSEPSPPTTATSPPATRRAPHGSSQALVPRGPSARPSAVTAIRAQLSAQEKALCQWKGPGASGATAPFSEQDLGLMAHFQHMTLFTLGGDEHMMGGAFVRELPRHAVEHPFLLHAMLAVAAAHRRTLEDWALRPAASEVARHQRALYTFGRRMARPMRRDDMEAMLVTAGLLNATDMAAIDTTDPARAWPNVDRPDALGWIAVGGGPKAITDSAAPWIEADAAGPPRDDGSREAQRLRDALARMHLTPDLSALPAGLVALCDVDAHSDRETHPYLAALQDTAPVLNRPDGGGFSLLRDSKFLGAMRPAFLARLRARDARALVVLARWYAKMATLALPWWMVKRVTVECKAICLFLRAHPDPRVRAEMRHPEAVSGYGPPAFARPPPPPGDRAVVDEGAPGAAAPRDGAAGWPAGAAKAPADAADFGAPRPAHPRGPHAGDAPHPAHALPPDAHAPSGAPAPAPPPYPSPVSASTYGSNPQRTPPAPHAAAGAASHSVQPEPHRAPPAPVAPAPAPAPAARGPAPAAPLSQVLNAPSVAPPRPASGPVPPLGTHGPSPPLSTPGGPPSNRPPSSQGPPSASSALSSLTGGGSATSTAARSPDAAASSAGHRAGQPEAYRPPVLPPRSA